jgi:hypothetical protein
LTLAQQLIANGNCLRNGIRMNIVDLIVGKPPKTSDERAEQIGPAEGIPIFGLDALSSAAYGPGAALSLLIPLGVLGVRYILLVSLAIIILLLIVFSSYLQTIATYPTVGGSYTVARSNLGPLSSLLAAAALLTDYILTAELPSPLELAPGFPLCLPSNLTWSRFASRFFSSSRFSTCVECAMPAFMMPTYLFVGTLPRHSSDASSSTVVVATRRAKRIKTASNQSNHSVRAAAMRAVETHRSLQEASPDTPIAAASSPDTSERTPSSPSPAGSLSTDTPATTIPRQS